MVRIHRDIFGHPPDVHPDGGGPVASGQPGKRDTVGPGPFLLNGAVQGREPVPGIGTAQGTPGGGTRVWVGTTFRVGIRATAPVSTPRK